MRFWADFEANADNELSLDSETLQAMLNRLARTGMYQEITGGYVDYGGGRGYLTPVFAGFLSALAISASDGRVFFGI
jgi:hypothetical protein